ncbi:MAG: hypothetical protein WAN66_20725 [Limnoraphis robusta]
MIQEYIQKAMQTAQYEILEYNESFYGLIPNGYAIAGSTGDVFMIHHRDSTGLFYLTGRVY